MKPQSQAGVERLPLRSSLQMLSPFKVLSVLFLAAFMLRSELSYLDIVCLSVSGELPFHKELVVAGTRMDPDGSCRILGMLGRVGKSSCAAT